MSAETKQRAIVFASQLQKTRSLKYAESLVSELEKWSIELSAKQSEDMKSIPIETALARETKTESANPEGAKPDGVARTVSVPTGAGDDDKKRDETVYGVLEKAVKDAIKSRDRYTGALGRDSLSELVAILYSASATFSCCNDKRCVTLWLEVAHLILGDRLAEKDARSRASSRKMALMFHETNGRHLFKFLAPHTSSASHSSSSATIATTTMPTTLELTPSVQAVIVADISTRFANLNNTTSAPHERSSDVDSQASFREIVRNVLAEYGVNTFMSHDELDRLCALATHH
jgi:hypothetical protein